jgi:hypothetical protein
MLRVSPALPVAPSILHVRQTQILMAIQEIKRKGRKAVSLKCTRKIDDQCSSSIDGRHSLNDVAFIKKK